MANALAELELKLRNNKIKLSDDERNVLSKYKDKAIRNFFIGGLLASGVSWTVASKLSWNKFNITTGAALMSGIWCFNKTLNSSLDDILSLDGSRLQRELATIVLARHGQDSHIMQLMNKYYYQEKVFDDSNFEILSSRWRLRNFSGDKFNFQEDEVQTDSHAESESSQSSAENFSSENLTTNVKISLSGDVFVDPFDFFFGNGLEMEDANMNSENIPSRKQRRRHKRSVRKHNV